MNRINTDDVAKTFQSSFVTIIVEDIFLHCGEVGYGLLAFIVIRQW